MDRYGEPPLPAQNLIAVARFRVGAREAGLSDVALQGNFIRFSPAQLPESKTMRLNRMYPGSQVKPALDAVLIPNLRRPGSVDGICRTQRSCNGPITSLKRFSLKYL